MYEYTDHKESDTEGSALSFIRDRLEMLVLTLISGVCAGKPGPKTEIVGRKSRHAAREVQRQKSLPSPDAR